MTTYYKVTKSDGSLHYGNGKWHLPKGKHPGKWMPPIKGELMACENGYHLCTRDSLIEWLGETIWVVEPKDEPQETGGKILCRQARLVRRLDTWNETTARLFACDCAERVLKIFEKQYPKDKRPRNAINTARQFAKGKATKQKLAAAGAAAWAAAWDAAWAVAGAAAWAVAWDAAGAAAWAAADAVRAAAGDAERNWQIDLLWKYLDGELDK